MTAKRKHIPHEEIPQARFPLPKRYRLTPLVDSNGEACGCYTAHSKKTTKPSTNCRAHGKPEAGIPDMIMYLEAHGVSRGQIMMQYPRESRPGGGRCNKGAVCSKGRARAGEYKPAPDMKIDIAVLCEDGTIVGYEVNDASHRNRDAKQRDAKKMASAGMIIHNVTVESLRCWRESGCKIVC